jgi:ankyrin repeat protein
MLAYLLQTHRETIHKETYKMRLLAILALLLSSILSAQQTTSSEILKENEFGWTPLGQACFEEKVDVIKEWFEKIGSEESVATVCKCIKSSTTEGYTPLMLSCSHNFETMSVYKYLLETLEKYEDKTTTADYIVQANEAGETSLMMASACGNIDVVKFFVGYIESAKGHKAAVEYIKLKDKKGDDAISHNEKNLTYQTLILYLKEYIEKNDK